VVGFLSSRSLAESARNVGAFQQGLSEAGFVVGQNVAVEYRWADGTVSVTELGLTSATKWLAAGAPCSNGVNPVTFFGQVRRKVKRPYLSDPNALTN
jgi:hypothetical protein